MAKLLYLILGLLRLAIKEIMNEGELSASSNGGLDETVEFLGSGEGGPYVVSSDGNHEMPGGDSLDLQVLRSVAGELEHLSSDVLEDGRATDGGSGADSVFGSD